MGIGITLDQQWGSILRYGPNIMESIRSKIGLKIGILVVIQIGFVICSFGILSYYDSQDTHLGNSINIAGKNRFLTSNIMFEISQYFSEGEGGSNDSPSLRSAMDQLESNLLTLKQGGMISDIDLRPLPSKFLEDWNTIYQEWVSLKTILTNTVIQPNGRINNVERTSPTIEALQTTTETTASSLLNSSNVLVTKLGEYARVSSQNSMMLQGIFAVLNIAVAALVLYLVMRILKPVYALTAATSEISKGNLDVTVEGKGNDELSILGSSFNSMVKSLKGYVIKQNELTKELENANDELKHKDLLKDEFINVAAHELRTPIQPILGLTEYLHCIKEGNSRSIPITVQQEDLLLGIILRNSKRLMQLTEDILDATKIESGSLILKKEKFDLNKMVMEILSEYRHRIKDSNRNNLALHYECQGDGAAIIVADRSRLCQVVNNMISNAFKFTNDGRIKVTVEQKENSNKVIVKIKDTGTGIHPDILPKLFTKFATKSDNGGTGLGLFISKSIIEKHGGIIWAENNKSDGGIGATFAFILPIDDTNKK
ncbi:MAG: ATP-binding protein [Nitrososphaeraceae archaeon]|jgi:signal transduction histidine kinase